MSNNNVSDEPATDVLAAEEFGVPAPDPALTPERLELPPDPISEEEPHDVLAAEEFAMPAPEEARVRRLVTPRRQSILKVIALNLPPVVLGVWAWRRVRRRSAAS